VTPTARLLRLAAWAVGVALALVALGATGQGSLAPPPLGSPGRWQAWFDQRDPTTAAFALLRLAAVGACWYLAAVTVVGAVLRLIRADVLVAVADRFTVAPVRRLLAGSVTLTLVGLGPTGMVVAVAQPASTSSSTSTVAASSDTVTMRRLPPPDAAPPAGIAPPAEAATSDRWTVQPGDCFWTIADDVLQRKWGRAPSDAEIVPYWLRLIEANEGQLADPANPDLIFPGQVFTVPPVS
jgi:hypothetical protein